MLAENPIDIQLLGIGSNGHIGFNEPGTDFNSKTHYVDLKEVLLKTMQDYSLMEMKMLFQNKQSLWEFKILWMLKVLF